MMIDEEKDKELQLLDADEAPEDPATDGPAWEKVEEAGAAAGNRKKWIILIAAAVVAFAALLTLGILLYLQVGQTDQYRKESQQYQQTLSQTQEGKKLLEEANEKLGDQNKKLDAEASDAKQQAADAEQRAEEANLKAAEAEQLAADAEQKKADAEKAAADAVKNLNAKKAELDKMNNSLSAKQGELDKANRGIAKFDELRELFISYANDANTANAALDDGWLAIMYNDREAYERNINILNTVYPRMNTTIDQILQLFDDIENKNY